MFWYTFKSPLPRFKRKPKAQQDQINIEREQMNTNTEWIKVVQLF